ncbi:hypothetical protein BASA81_004860 [Batrachochytrium salamandrivorans]|nr:hypothetical protein BASA81_004860 [Batrachochytrium salamandrivorans]
MSWNLSMPSSPRFKHGSTLKLQLSKTAFAKFPCFSPWSRRDSFSGLTLVDEISNVGANVGANLHRRPLPLPHTTRTETTPHASKQAKMLPNSAYEASSRFTMLGYLLRKLDSLLMHLFFGDVDIVGIENIPRTGPCLLVGNHKNQFVDALMVVYVTNRPVSFLVAEKSMKLGLVGLGARLTSAIPVVRAQDLARNSKHGLLLAYCHTTRVLTGSKECAFPLQCEVGELISIRGFQPAQIVEFIAQSQIRVKVLETEEGNMEFVFPSGGMRFKFIPKVEQREMFDTVFAALDVGRCIGIFPEGGSSDRTDLLPLKVGVSIMALGAKSRDIPVQVVPFGINYERGHVWRSKVMVHVGKPVQITDAVMTKYAAEPREATVEFLKQVEHRLRGVTFNAPDQRTLLIMRVMRRLFQGQSKLTLVEFMELNRRFALAFSKFSENRRFLDLVGRVHAYICLLEHTKVTDREIAALPRLGGVRQSIYSSISLMWTVSTVVLSFLFFLPVWLVFLPSLLRINCVVKREVRRALATSTVKVLGKDVAASQKIFSGLVWMPFTVLVCTLVVMICTITFWGDMINPFEPGSVQFILHNNGKWLLPLTVLLLLPVLGVVHIKVFDYQLNRLGWAGYYRLILLHPTEGNRLRELRKELAFRVQEFYHEVARHQFPEWEKEDILPRSTVVKLRAQSDYEAEERIKAEEEVNLEDQRRGSHSSEGESDEDITEEEQMTIRLLQPNMISVGGRISSNNRF